MKTRLADSKRSGRNTFVEVVYIPWRAYMRCFDMAVRLPAKNGPAPMLAGLLIKKLSSYMTKD
jgi:hypothetical protein